MIKRKIRNIELSYPRVDGNFNAVEIDLVCTRASEGILIEYDFKRDGWVISQSTVHEWDINDEVCDPKYIEVAFIKSWQLEKGADGGGG